MTVKKIIVPSAGMFCEPSAESGRETEALFGETIEILQEMTTETGEAWAKIILTTDGYEAWIRQEALGELPEANCHVVVPRALMTAQPDIKAPAAGYLPMGSLVATEKTADERMRAVLGVGGNLLGYILADHVLALGVYLDDYVAVAEQMMGCPYRWGGRDSFGIDCSALIQLSMATTGRAVPRNSGEQEKAIGTTIDHIDDLERGDLIFWKGHVGILTNKQTLLHANMWHGMVASENFRNALSRLEKVTGGITQLTRP